MENPQYLQVSLTYTVGDQVRTIGDHPLPGIGQATFATTGRKMAQVSNAAQDGFDEFRGGLRTVLCNVGGFFIEVLEGGAQPLNVPCQSI
jgi:hypothetical protein